jgi:hypothetical protein|eukprot:COSAG02_NODE_2109_length_9808_cov_4.669379_10_plen_178_part_00
MPKKGKNGTGLAAAISRVALAAESVLGGGSPRGAAGKAAGGSRRRTGAAVPPPKGPSMKQRGGSKKGRVQVKRPKGYQARRRAAVLYQYEVNADSFQGLATIPDVPQGAPKRGQPVHIARKIAEAISKDGERPVATKWVLGILREIHAVGIEAYDPQKDGRSAKRKPRKSGRPMPPK